MSTMRQIVLRSYAKGEPRAEDFALETVPVPEAGPGEVLLKSYWLSLDPLIRFAVDEKTISGRTRVDLGGVMYGGAVSQVIASNVDGYAPGDWVEGRTGWREQAVVDPAKVPLRKFDIGAAPKSAAVGMLGMPGKTAHTAMTAIGRVKAGETVAISAAAGAVGSMAGQIAKILGARVVGIAGGPDKCRAVEALGFDACVDYKALDFREQLAAATPGGIHAYLENVGGDVMLAVMPNLAYNARMIVCGFIAYYGVGLEGPGPDNLPGFMRGIMAKGLEIRGFGGILAPDQPAYGDLARWYAEGRLKLTETVVEGLENAPAAFEGIFRGNANVGKLMVRIAPEPR